MRIDLLKKEAQKYLEMALLEFGLDKPWLKVEVVQSPISDDITLYLSMKLVSRDDLLKDDSFQFVHKNMELIAKAISESPYVESFKNENERLEKENQKLIEQNRELYLLLDGAHLAKFGKRLEKLEG